MEANSNIAVNEIEITTELFKESFYAVFSKRKQKMLMNCGLVFILAGAVIMVIQYFLHMTSLLLSATILFPGIFVIVWAIRLPQTEYKRKLKLFNLKNKDGNRKRITCFSYGDFSVQADGQDPVYFDYTEISEWKETEHLLILICNDHTGIMLDKTGFTVGNAEIIKKQEQKCKNALEKTN